MVLSGVKIERQTYLNNGLSIHVVHWKEEEEEEEVSLAVQVLLVFNIILLISSLIHYYLFHYIFSKLDPLSYKVSFTWRMVR